MKKVCTIVMVLCLLLTGCSVVSQQEYDDLVSKNAELQSQIDQLQSETGKTGSESETELSGTEEASYETNQQETEMSEPVAIQYTSPKGFLWLIYNDEIVQKCYTVVDDKSFSKYTDEQIIDAIYVIVEDFAFSYISESDYALPSYLFVLGVDGNAIGYATIEMNSPSDKGVTWLEGYEHYNNHSQNISNAKDFSYFWGSKSDITIDNYNICFSGEYSFISADEADDFIYMYLLSSDSEATELIAVEVDVENKAYASRNFDVYVSINAPNGKTLMDCSSCFDDGIGGSLVELPSKSVVSKRFYIPYEGDGEYKIEFGDPFDVVKQIYIIEVKKP